MSVRSRQDVSLLLFRENISLRYLISGCVEERERVVVSVRIFILKMISLTSGIKKRSP
jgi:hypothetical protein